MCRRGRFDEAFFFEAPFAEVPFAEVPFAVVLSEAPPFDAARWFRCSALVFAVGFAGVPLEVPDPAPAAAAGFGLRRLRRRFRGGGSPETEGTSSPAMTCG
jgi:hypothetical protein